VRRKLSTSGHVSMFYEPDRGGGRRKPTEYSSYELWREGIQHIGGEVSKFKDEVFCKLRCDNFAELEHGDYELLWKFDNKEMINSWIVTTDQDNDEGHSTAEFVILPIIVGYFEDALTQLSRKMASSNGLDIATFDLHRTLYGHIFA